MFVGQSIKISKGWYFGRKNFIITFCISSIAIVLYKYLDIKIVAIPFLPIGTIGTSVAFYIGFKNNQAYNRLWEARQLWGGLTNTSRNFAAQVLAIVNDKVWVKQHLYLHLAYLNILRLQLRKTIPWATSNQDLHQHFDINRDELQTFSEGLYHVLKENEALAYYEVLKNKTNPAACIIAEQLVAIKRLKTEHIIDSHEHSALVHLFSEFLRLQGGCERIKSTPLFRQYTISSRVFVHIFVFLIPFGLLKDMNGLGDWGIYLVIPFALLLSWIFTSMEQIGEFSENPFDNAINDIPMNTICRNIEIDLKDLMNEANLPPRLEPVDDILL
jgi:ion channel-forming bestrophin family protein